jgi:glycerophosphoryl diester phosphodiesterase
MLTMRPPAIVAHRGLHAEHPENSLSAFAAAWAAGVQWCECDVHASADCVPVVIHDQTLDRTTSKSGRVSDMPMTELAGVVPTLRQVLTAMPAACGMLAEIKPADADLVAAVLNETSGRRCIIQSFDAGNLHLAQRHNPTVDVALLVETEPELIRAMAGSWLRIHIDHRLLALPAAAEIRRQGKSLGVWTVNTAAEIDQALRFGADVLITNEPILLRTMCGAAGNLLPGER